MTVADAAISIRSLVKRYGDRTVVDGLSLEVRRGEIVALLGPNGAGKTTTVEIVEGYRRPDAGEVRVLGLDPVRDGSSLRPRVGLMLQSGGVYSYGRPRELLRLYASFFAAPADPDALVRQVGLDEVANRPYRVLSGGEKQRLSLALALVGRPELVLLDEPTAGMDPVVRAETRRLIASLRSDGVTVLLTTHDLGDVEALADRVAIIAHGRMLAEGVPASIAADGTATDLSVRFLAPLADADINAFYADFPAPKVEGRPDGFRVPAGGTDPDLTARVTSYCASRQVQIAELRTGGASLEERYLALVGSEAANEAEPAPAGDGRRRRRGGP